MKRDRLSELLNLTVERGTLRVRNRESDHREFKLTFDSKNLPRYAKTMAAFSNRDGGIIFFGVKDRPRLLIGVDDGEIPDENTISNFLKEYFQPEIPFQTTTLEIYGKKVYAIIVSSALKKPVLCRKSKSIKQDNGNPDKPVLREGAIYYRYSASSDEIKYSELRSLLDYEQQAYFKSMIDNITLLNDVGHDRAAVIDVANLSGKDYTAPVYLTNETAKGLNWIEGGRFVENPEDGSDAYYVVRSVEIKHGVEVPKPTDFAKTHPLTKTGLSKDVKINSIIFDAVIWKLGIKDNPAFHIASTHGKNRIHKFTESAKRIILDKFPLDMEDRKAALDQVYQEYTHALRTRA